MFLAWDPDDQAKALAWQREQRKVCPSCGTRDEEWTADDFVYIADTHRCPGCELLEIERRNIDPEDAKGVHISLVRNREPR